jgi:NADPH-dependent curcumin reductase CurA
LGSGKVVGICGTDEKCEYIKELGFDTAINYKTTKDMKGALQGSCPQGVDMYFDNVGGTISEEVSSLVMKVEHSNNSKILCGAIG